MRASWLEKLIFGASVMVLTSNALPVFAVGLSIQPARLELAAEWGNTASGEMLVANVTRQPAMYQVLHASAADEVQVQPSSFRLDPGGSQLVTVKYTPRGITDRQVTLDVVANPLAREPLALASGIRYSLELTATGGWFGYGFRALLLLVVALIAVSAIRRRLTQLGGIRMHAE